MDSVTVTVEYDTIDNAGEYIPGGGLFTYQQ